MLPWGYMATEDIQRASSKFILSCYGLSACADLTEARVRSWERKMGRNVLEPPKLKSLPPTVEAFNQNVLRAHLAASIMKGSLNPDPPPLSPKDYGWYTPTGHDMLLPQVTPEGTIMAPSALIKLIKCGCKTTEPCSTKQCSCKKHSLKCTFLCHCRASGSCKNMPIIQND